MPTVCKSEVDNDSPQFIVEIVLRHDFIILSAFLKFYRLLAVIEHVQIERELTPIIDFDLAHRVVV